MLLGVFGCSKDDRYAPPPWLGGDNIETLKDEKYGGNYSIFLKLMDKSENTVSITNQLFTLFVPNDEAFQKYFQSIGISSVDELTKTEAQELFALHKLDNPRSRYYLIYEYVWGEFNDPDGEYAALFFRKPTTSTSAPYFEKVRYYDDPALLGTDVLVSSGIKLMPLFSNDYFEDYGADPNGSDYDFLFSGNRWDRTSAVKDKAMAWGNAVVLPNPANPNEMEVRTKSGFIYFVDQVVPRQKNIDQYMAENQDKYGLFYDLMQRFAKYAAGGKDPQNRQLYTKSYDLVSNIAQEQGPFTGNENRLFNAFTAYIPTNDVLQKYLDEKVLPTYGSIDSIPRITLYYILQTHINSSLGWVSKITRNYFNAFGEQSVMNKDDIASAQWCSNGAFYEMKRVLEPNAFNCVPGTLFFDKKYSTFLYALDQTNFLKGLASLTEKVTLFAPTNEEIEAYNIRYSVTNKTIEFKAGDGVWRKMDAKELEQFVLDHIYNGNITDLSGEGYIRMASGNYIHYKNGAVRGAINQWLHEYASVDQKIVPEKDNGTLYSIGKPIKNKMSFALWLTRDKSVSKFKAAMIKASLLNDRPKDANRDSVPSVNFFAEADYWTAFIPTNEAMDAAEAAGLIPTDKKLLQAFLHHHFIRGTTVFDDGQKSGVFDSQYNSGTDPVTNLKVYAPLTVQNANYSMSVQDASGQVVSVDHSKADILVRQGVVHKIDKVLKY